MTPTRRYAAAMMLVNHSASHGARLTAWWGKPSHPTLPSILRTDASFLAPAVIEWGKLYGRYGYRTMATLLRQRG